MATYCDLVSSGLTLSCIRGNLIGGVANVWITSLPILSGASSNSQNIITGVTLQNLSGINKFFKYELLRESCQFDEEIISNPATGILYYQPKVTLFFPKRQSQLRNQITLMAKERLVILLQDNNGLLWLVGADSTSSTGTVFGGLDLVNGSAANTGKVADDANGYTLILQGKCKDMAREVQSSIVSTTSGTGILLVDSL